MSAALERRYRRWLRVYPRDYRAQRGEEILGTLLDTSCECQNRPSVRDVLTLVRHGVGMRLAAGPGPFRPAALALAAPLASAVAAGLALISLVFGELPLYGSDPGYRPNQFAYTIFESRAVFVYPLVTLAGVARLVGKARASRWLSVAAVAAAAVMYLWPAPGWVLGGPPPLRILLAITICCVPAALLERPADTLRQRLVGAATIVGLAVAGVLNFAGRPHGHPNSDPRSVFYLEDGLIATWRTFAPLAALAILVTAAVLARRRKQVEMWHAAAWALVPAALATFTPRRGFVPQTGTWGYLTPFLFVMGLTMVVVLVNTLLRYRRPSSPATAPEA